MKTTCWFDENLQTVSKCSRTVCLNFFVNLNFRIDLRSSDLIDAKKTIFFVEKIYLLIVCESLVDSSPQCNELNQIFNRTKGILDKPYTLRLE